MTLFLRITKSVVGWFLGATLAITASAQDKTPLPEAMPQLSNPKMSISGAKGGCGQACLYLKANDVLTLQAEYIQKMTEKLLEARKDKDKTVFKNNLGTFCKTQRVALGETWDDSWDRCLASYLDASARSLQMIRKALVQNYDTIAQLSQSQATLATKATADPKNMQQILKDPQALKKLKLYPDFPFHPSLEAIDPILKRLSESARQALHQRRSGDGGQDDRQNEALAQWWELYPRCPAEEEFPQIELVERYPNHPTGEKLPRILMGRDGKIVHDVVKFQEALKACVQKQQDHFQELPLELKAVRVSEEAKSAFTEAQEYMLSLIRKKAQEKGRADKTVDHVTMLGQSADAASAKEEPGADLDKAVLQLRQAAEALRK